MCGRFTLKTSAANLAAAFAGATFESLSPRYNICPTQLVACIRSDQAGQPQPAQLRWGLVPFWASDLKIGARMINARSETVAEKPAFRAAFRKRRCLVLADGFYEWKKEGTSKQPWYISRTDGGPFAMAGLWESWREPDQPESPCIQTCTILTTNANAMMRPLHDRMPVILDPEVHAAWLDADFRDRERLQSWLVPADSDSLQAWPVDRRVNRPAHDAPDCIEPLAS